MKKFKLSFLVQGHVDQTIEITNKDYIPNEIIKMLNNGKILTTIQNGGKIIIDENGIEIGKIINIDNWLEYSDFEEI